MIMICREWCSQGMMSLFSDCTVWRWRISLLEMLTGIRLSWRDLKSWRVGRLLRWCCPTRTPRTAAISRPQKQFVSGRRWLTVLSGIWCFDAWHEVCKKLRRKGGSRNTWTWFVGRFCRGSGSIMQRRGTTCSQIKSRFVSLRAVAIGPVSSSLVFVVKEQSFGRWRQWRCAVCFETQLQRQPWLPWACVHHRHWETCRRVRLLQEVQKIEHWNTF